MTTLVLCGDCILSPSLTACWSPLTVTDHLNHILLFLSHKWASGILKKPLIPMLRTVVLQTVAWIKEIDGHSCSGVRSSTKRQLTPERPSLSYTQQEAFLTEERSFLAVFEAAPQRNQTALWDLLKQKYVNHSRITRVSTSDIAKVLSN